MLSIKSCQTGSHSILLPVAWLRLFEVFNAMTEAETEVEIDYE
jgi:hypothetical protein